MAGKFQLVNGYIRLVNSSFGLVNSNFLEVVNLDSIIILALLLW